MDNENIKEILDNFEKYEARYKLHNETQFIITHREIEPLLDYITNLQAIEQEHQHINGELREENKRLREQLEAKD